METHLSPWFGDKTVSERRLLLTVLQHSIFNLGGVNYSQIPEQQIFLAIVEFEIVLTFLAELAYLAASSPSLPL